jgi:hypothetical protein
MAMSRPRAPSTAGSTDAGAIAASPIASRAIQIASALTALAIVLGSWALAFRVPN